jgi:hypothetical protein
MMTRKLTISDLSRKKRKQLLSQDNWRKKNLFLRDRPAVISQTYRCDFTNLNDHSDLADSLYDKRNTVKLRQMNAVQAVNISQMNQ